jgi:hypothetical protein
MLHIGKDGKPVVISPLSRGIHSILAQKTVFAFRVFGTRIAIPKHTNDRLSDFGCADSQ